jgi:two-component system, chemotaxis family, protein-glutamate methylesterase/glutaminase
MAAEFKIIVVGASAGGVTALKQLVAGLPKDLAAAAFVVLHIRPDAVSNLSEILNQCGALPAVEPKDGDKMHAGRLYVARPDHHLLVDGDRIGVKKGPRENRFRPSIDALFRSAAYSHGSRVIGVVLSGALDDGTSGLWSIKRLGGITIVQDPREAAFDSMPLHALDQVHIDHTASVKEMGALIADLARTSADTRAAAPDDLVERMRIEIEVAASANAFKKGIMKHGELTEFTCPECHGALVLLSEGAITRFRCHTGHGFSVSSLLAGITEAVGTSLWEVTRALEESVMLLDHMARHAGESGQPEDAEKFRKKARETEQRARTLQDLTINHEHLSQDALREKGL